jgi:RHH-type rel operon transcriptional repressor/antitoxin RelB
MPSGPCESKGVTGKLTLFIRDAIHVLQPGGTMLAIRLPAEIERRLEELAKKTGRTKSYYVRQAILEYLEDLEDFYLAEERLRTFGEAKVIPLEEIMKRHGLED